MLCFAHDLPNHLGDDRIIRFPRSEGRNAGRLWQGCPNSTKSYMTVSAEFPRKSVEGRSWSCISPVLSSQAEAATLRLGGWRWSLYPSNGIIRRSSSRRSTVCYHTGSVPALRIFCCQTARKAFSPSISIQNKRVLPLLFR